MRLVTRDTEMKRRSFFWTIFGAIGAAVMPPSFNDPMPKFKVNLKEVDDYARGSENGLFTGQYMDWDNRVVYKWNP